jgi:hypothetical protein
MPTPLPTIYPTTYLYSEAKRGTMAHPMYIYFIMGILMLVIFILLAWLKSMRSKKRKTVRERVAASVSMGHINMNYSDSFSEYSEGISEHSEGIVTSTRLGH